jgi:diguanylate cyclase (GGDEF)-like protein/PAS domain S-box-containing protein
MVTELPPLDRTNLDLAVISDPVVVSPEMPLTQAVSLIEQIHLTLAPAPGALTQEPGLALQRLHQKARSRCLVVAQANKPLGLVTEADIVRRLSLGATPFYQLSVGQVTTPPSAIISEADVLDGIDLGVWHQAAYAPIVVVKPDGCLRGVITLESLLSLAGRDRLVTSPSPWGQRCQGDHFLTSPRPNKLQPQPSQQPEITIDLAHQDDRISPRPSLGQLAQSPSTTMLQDIVSSAPACMIRFRLFPDATWQYDFFSQGSTLVFGFSPSELLSQPDLWSSRLMDSNLEDGKIPAAQRVLQGQTHVDLDFQFHHGDGSVRWIEERCYAHWNEAQQCWVVTSVTLDITQRKTLEAQLQQSEAELRALFDAMDELVLVLDDQGRYLKIVSIDSSTLYRPESELLGKTIPEIFPPEQANQFLQLIHQTLAHQTTQELEYALVLDDQIRWFSARCSPAAEDRVIWVARDITDRVRLDEERQHNELFLRRSEAKRRAILAAMPDLMFLLGADGRYREVITPRPDLEMFFQGRNPVGQRLLDLVPAAIAHRKLAVKDEALATGELQIYEQTFETDNGTRHEEVRVIKSSDDEVLFMIRDITDRKQAQAQIIHNALHDPLTDLPNRTLLEERLKILIQRAKRDSSYRYAVLFIDLDRFKVINDSLGHLVGDELLVAIAQRIQSHIRETDLAARLGGDEFVLLLENIDGPDTAAQIAQRLLADCQEPLTIHGHEVFTGMSIGIATGSSRYTVASDLIRDADIAMYRAKQSRQASYQFFDSAMHTEMLERHTLEMELHRAIEQKELVVHYQPIFDLTQTGLVGFEALVRWRHPKRGFLPPDVFLACAEDSGLIVSIDRWVLSQAGHQLRQWQQRTGCPLTMHVNLSAQNFTTNTLLKHIDEVLEDVGLTYPWLTVEITENILIDDIANATELLNQLKNRQIQTSIDDFGIGYSSLQYLHRLPLQSLKIDRSFVHQIDTSNRDYQMVKTIAGLGQQLNLAIIAEGIEHHHQLKILQNLGCQFGQGYLFSRPLPAVDIAAQFLSVGNI